MTSPPALEGWRQEEGAVLECHLLMLSYKVEESIQKGAGSGLLPLPPPELFTALAELFLFIHSLT